MRFPLIRSVLRTAIAVGVISSYQSSSLASCWNELLRPNAGVCYIYDLQSDEFAGSSLSKQEVDSIATAIQSVVNADQPCNGFDLCSSESNGVDSSESAFEPVDTSRTDWDDCIAAAKRYEMRSNFDAAWAQIGSQASSLINQRDRLFSAYGQARTLFTSFARNSSIQLVELIRINESLPVAGITTDPITESLTDTTVSIESDWNCNDWNQPHDQPHDQVPCLEASGVFPVRGHANIFVFCHHGSEPVDNTWQGEIDAVSPEIDTVSPEIDTVYLEIDTVYPEIDTVYPEIDTVYPELDTVYPELDTVSPEIDTVSPELDTLSPELDTLSPEIDTLSPDTDTVSPETDTVSPEIDTISPEIDTLSPEIDTLSPEIDTLSPEIDTVSPEIDTVSPEIDAVSPEIDAVSPEQAPVSPELAPVCPELDRSNNACHWADLFEQPRICCPLDTQKQDEPVADSSVSDIPVTADPIRPPTLQSDGEQIDPPIDELSYDLATSQPVHWNLWSGQRSFGGGYRAAWLEPASPIGKFSREDLQYATKFSSELPNNTLNEIDHVSNVDAPSLASDIAPAIETFVSKDFLVQRHESTFGTLILPLTSPQQIAVDYAMKHLRGTSDDTRLNASKSLANQVRTVGEFLVDFAMQLETEAERVEIARRDSNQR